LGWLPCSRARSYIEAVGGVEAVVGDYAQVFNGTRKICQLWRRYRSAEGVVKRARWLL